MVIIIEGVVSISTVIFDWKLSVTIAVTRIIIFREGLIIANIKYKYTGITVGKGCEHVQ